MKREVLAEFLGSLLLAAAVIGSGVMAERLAAGNAAVALLGNTLATVTALGVLIAMLAPISGAHFNPAVTLVALAQRKIAASQAGAYVLAQVAGCCAGAMLAHLMFELPLVGASTHSRAGIAQWLSEVVATAGLILVIFTSPTLGAAARRVPAWIAAAYWFTASTSFANPAITVARSLTDTFSGIRPQDVPGFVIAQVVGAGVGMLLLRALSERNKPLPSAPAIVTEEGT
ncbi:MAG TPA: MIP/aquaporin family protein [Steroidobacteraceae bacterium]|nr:MIP/aquaporin family protein [Steroidobacteraceae bacterium]